MSRRTPPLSATLLGYAGILPFAAFTVAAVLGDMRARQTAVDGFLIYAAVILSFLGGIRWGAASASGRRVASALKISVLPSLWAAAFLWWPSERVAALGLMLGFVLMGLADGLRPGPGVPEWMLPLRWRLTAAVVICHLVVLRVM